jgi:uroporphyrinogen-III synthase
MGRTEECPVEGLHGKTVVLTGTRKTEELRTLVEKLGGTAVLRPLQGVVKADPDHVRGELQKLLGQPFDWMIFTTGIGVELLHQSAQSSHQETQFLAALRQAHIAVRGYKTARYLKSIGIDATVRDEDGTTASLLTGMERTGLSNKTVALQLHGEPAPELVDLLRYRASYVAEIMPYRHVPPETDTLEVLLREILEAKVDAVTFTSTPQVRFLMEYARSRQCKDALVAAFSRVIPVAVGKVTAEALRTEGITQVVWPKEERMGSMMIALARYFAEGDANATKEARM